MRSYARIGAIILSIFVLFSGSPVIAYSIRDYQWYLEATDVPKANKVSSGAGVVVAVLDSGVDSTVPTLQGQVLSGTVIREEGSDGRSDSDAKGHGTGMAGIIAGRGQTPNDVLGVAPAAKILPVNTIKSGDLAGGIRYAVDRGATVINISGAYPLDASLVESSVRYALDRDVVIVASAGNADQGDEGVQVPASIPGVIAVGATDEKGQLVSDSVKGKEMVVAAPGIEITVPIPGSQRTGIRRLVAGTSPAAAYTSGVVALVRARFPGMDAANVINRVVRTAKDFGPEGRDPGYGFGTVRPYRALTDSVPTVDRNPLGEPPAPTPSAGPSRGIGGGLVAWVVGAIVVVAIVVVLVIVFVARARRVRRAR